MASGSSLGDAAPRPTARQVETAQEWGQAAMLEQLRQLKRDYPQRIARDGLFGQPLKDGGWDPSDDRYKDLYCDTRITGQMEGRDFPAPEDVMMRMLTDREQKVTDSVRDYVVAHLPREVEGHVGNAIGKALTRVGEYHWKDVANRREHWAYELVFTLDGEEVTFRKAFEADRLITECAEPNIPYLSIMRCLILNDTEVALLATAI